jgi:hypothetical protein
VNIFFFFFCFANNNNNVEEKHRAPRETHKKFHCTILFLFSSQYFPTNVYTWIVYCAIVFVLVTALKLINLSLHKMYDKARTMSETSLKKLSSGNTASGIVNSKIQRETSGDDEGGIELQILNQTTTLPVDHSSRTSVEHHSQSDELSCANSAVSVDFQEQLASTIGEFVDLGFEPRQPFSL